MIDYRDPILVDEIRQFHNMIGKRFEDDKNYCLDESVVAKYLMSVVSRVIVRLDRSEQIEWSAALARREPEYAEGMGWTLSRDVPDLLRHSFGPTFDFDEFATFWRAHIPGFSVVDIDVPFDRNVTKSKTWQEHVVRYLHHCPLFYKEA